MIFIVTLLAGCKEEETGLPSVEDRVSEVLDGLQDRLTEPANGWKITYRPTANSGSFFMLMDFGRDGLVKISTDLAADDGRYFEESIPYRLDAGQGIELIFETFGALHYLFELDQASFGAEFEFVFVEDQGDDLIFRSKTDPTNPTRVTFEPASAADVNLLSKEISANLNLFKGQAPRLFGGVAPSQQLYLSDIDVSVFWNIDLERRTIFFDIAGKGATAQSVYTGANVILEQAVGYRFLNGQLVLNVPVSFSLDGSNIRLEAISLVDFSTDGASLCSGVSTTPQYTVSTSNHGAGVLNKSLINSSGLGFEELSQSFYSVNIPFIFDDSLSSLAETGSIAELLPNGSGFMITYGFKSDSIPANSVGFIVEGEDGSGELYLREMSISAVANQLEITLLDDYYYSATPTTAEESAMEQITNEIFEGGSIYAFDLPIQGLTVLQFYNPCNGYEFILVK